MINSISFRKDLLYIAHKSSASHIGSCLSCIDILVSLFSYIDINKIKKQENSRDRIILSKGHAAAALYTVMYRVGLITKSEFDTYYSNGTILSGHSNHFHPMIEHSTGALGHGLSVGVGVCLGFNAKQYDTSRVFVVLGDGEMNEGSNYEALMIAGHMQLNNLVVIVDNNKLGGIGKTDDYCSIEPLEDKFESFGFDSYRINGHDSQAILDCIKKTKRSEKPISIICDTVKGKGVPFMESQNVWHYRPLDDKSYGVALKELY